MIELDEDQELREALDAYLSAELGGRVVIISDSGARADLLGIKGDAIMKIGYSLPDGDEVYQFVLAHMC